MKQDIDGGESESAMTGVKQLARVTCPDVTAAGEFQR